MYTEVINGDVVEREEKYDFIVAGHDAWFSNVRDQQGKTLIDYYQDGGYTDLSRLLQTAS